MKRLVEFLVGISAAALVAPAAFAAEPPTSAAILSKLHRANQREIDVGQMAVEHARGKDVKSYGRTLVKDHSDADKKVAKVASEEKVNLADTSSAAEDTETLPSGDAFDAEFVKMMLDDHRRDIAELEVARAATSDARLRRLIAELLPVLRRHEAAAQRLVDRATRS